MLFTSWDSTASSEETDEILITIALGLAARITCAAERERITGHLSDRDVLALCDYCFPYSSASAYDCLLIRQISALFSKRADLTVKLEVSPREAAVRTFIASELLCRETNDILRSVRSGTFSFMPEVSSVLYRARQKIASILGDVPTLDRLRLRYGPGATTSLTRRRASPRRKLGQTLACSEELLPRVREVLQELPLLCDQHDTKGGFSNESWTVPVEIHPGRLNFVPKTYKTDRSIAVEPNLNTMCQAGIGDYMLDLLRESGIDLRDQTRNQRLAREGSISGALATLDLSSASDTIATEAVFELLPVEWALFLSEFRSGTVECEGVPIRMEKFATAGNGFTFPLETVIFYGLAYACCERGETVSVYGDDIIVPSSRYPLLARVLNCLGFLVNAKKSFSEGPFRESCGADYLKGINIRPFYQKGPLTTRDIFRLHNHIVRCNHEWEDVIGFLLSLIDGPVKRFGPDGYGDGHLLGDPEWRPHKRELGWSGFTFETYTDLPVRDFTVTPGDRIYPFYSSYIRSGGGDSPPHTYKNGKLGVSVPGTRGYRLIKIYTLTR